MPRKNHDLSADLRAGKKREQRIQQVTTFAEEMHRAQLPEPFAGAVLTAVRQWSALADIAHWEELRAANAEQRIEDMFADYDRLAKGDASHPFVAEIVEAVTQTAMSKFIAIMARDAGVSESVMAATVAALTGQPVAPNLRGDVWALLERAATGMADDTQEASA